MQEETERDMHEEDNTKKFGDDYCVTFFGQCRRVMPRPRVM